MKKTSYTDYLEYLRNGGDLRVRQNYVHIRVYGNFKDWLLYIREEEFYRNCRKLECLYNVRLVKEKGDTDDLI